MMSERLSSSDSPAKVAGQNLRERDLIMVVTELVRELHPQRFRFIDVRPSSRIERDLGIDSLGRTELILRIERAFRVRLPARTRNWFSPPISRSSAAWSNMAAISAFCTGIARDLRRPEFRWEISHASIGLN
jgi:acyl carrier protein